MSNGYGQSNTLKSGTLSVEIGGEKITFKVSKSDIKDLNAGKVSEIRGKIARQV
jgi:multisubunit Na+/H+ antiporter MnhE subunit